MITAQQLGQILPYSKAIASDVVALFETMFPKYGIISKQQAAAFIAQTGHETAGYTRLVENLNYSEQALANTWPKRFSTGRKHDVKGKMCLEPNDLAKQIARNPEKIANNVYANRLGNGDTASGEGWKYRGRGAMQTTGKYNYQKVKDATGWDVISDPDMLGKLDRAIEAALIFWRDNELNKYVAKDDFEGLTKAINGGTIGLAERTHLWKRAKDILNIG